MNKLLCASLFGLCGLLSAQTTISNVYVQSSTATTATIVWTTSTPSTSQILYGYNNTLPYSNNVNQSPVTSHSMTLTILNANQPYYFAVVSSGVQSSIYEFALCGQPQVPVSGTVNQFYYSGTYTLTWNPPAGSGGTPTVCGQGFSTTITGGLNLAGSFSSQVADSMKVTPGPGTWTVTVADIGDISPISVTLPLSTLTQDISSQLQTAAAATSLVGVIANNNSQKAYPPWIGSGGGGGPTIETNSVSNSSQALLNFETSTANSVGLTVTPSNPSGGIEKEEVTGAYSGTLISSQITTALGYTPVAPTVTTLSDLTTAAGGAFGTAAYVNTGISGATIPLLNGSPTASGSWTFSAVNALTLSNMTGTSCLEEISGVVTATGSGCGSSSGGTNVEVNGSSALSVANLTNTSGAGGIDVTNPSGALVEFTLNNTATTVNSQTCTLGSTCTIPFQTNSSGNTSQAGINLETSTANSVGLTVTPVNSATNVEKFEITGSSYTGNAATATLATSATNIAGGVANDIPYQTGAGATSFIAPVNSAVLVTSAGGVPSESTTLPSGLTIPGYLTSSGISGMTTGQVPLAATVTTITSSEPLAGAGAGITTGPVSGTTANHLVTENGTNGQIKDSGVLITAIPAADIAAGALANGMTATTQTVGDNTTDVATDAFVLANAGSGCANALTMNNSGSGASSGTTFNCSGAVTASYNTFGAAPALGNNVPQTTSFTIVVNTVHRFTGSGASNATTPASVTTGFIASIWNQGTAAVTVVTGGPTLVCVPSTCIVPVGAAASITTDGTNFDVQISNALGSAFGTAANVNTGTSGATVPLLNGANTWGGLQTFGTNFSVGGVTATGATGTGNVVFSISPALTGTPDASGATQFKLPVGAGFATLANGESGFDTTNKNWHDWANAVDNLRLILPASGTYTNGHCLQISNASGVITGTDAGSSCGSDSGGGTSGWSGTPITFISTTTQYAPPVGGSLTNGTESVADVASPVAQTISNLSVSLSAALGAGATLQVTFMDGGVPQALTCTTATGGASCVDSTHSFNVAKNDLIDFRLVSSGTVTAGVPQIVITYAAGTSSVGVTSIATTGPITGGTITSTGTIACATCVVASSPGAGVAHFAGSTQTVTSSAVTPSDATGNTTGSGNFVLVTSPTLVTPALGAATATSLLATGIVDGQAPITITTGTTANLGSTYNSGYTFNQEGTAGTGVTYTLPATAAGKQYCVQNSGTTSVVNIGVLTVYPPSSSFVIYKGVVNTVGGGGTHGIASGGAAGDSACFVAIDSTHWEVFSGSGTWTLN